MVRPSVLLVLSDAFALFLSVVTAYWLRFQSGLIPIKDFQPISFYLYSFLTVMPLYLFLSYALGNYQNRRGKLNQYEIQSIVRSLVVFYMLCLVITFFVHTQEHSRLTVLLASLMNVVFCLCFRQAVVFYQIRRWKKDKDISRILILGKDQVMMQEFAEYLETHPQLGYRVAGVKMLQYAGSCNGCDRVILVGDVSYSEISDIVLNAPAKIRIDFLPTYYLLLQSFPFKDQIGSFHLLPLNQQIFLDWNSAVKRVMDVMISSTLLIVLFPLLFFITIGILLTYGKPVFFRQERVGRNGTLFGLYKFRTMKPDAEKEISDWIVANKQTIYKKKNDPRVEGAFAWFLRRTGLDELPQLWNVLCGDMSLVGPRPATLELVKNYSAEHKIRLSVLPGITGLQQAYCRGTDSMEEILKYDFEYVRQQTIWLDLVILTKTLKTVISGKGVP